MTPLRDGPASGPGKSGSGRSRAGAVRTLLLTLQYPNRASYYDDWSDAFLASPDQDCVVMNILGADPKSLGRRLEEFDATVMLHSCNSDTLDYFKAVAPVLASRRRPKLAIFAGNEYNSPYVSMPGKTALFKASRADIVATQLLAEAGEFLYGGPDAPYRVISVPHALNPAVFEPGPSHERRSLDIGVKGYRYPAYLGDEDRNQIISLFQAAAARWGLAIDISEDKRLSRMQWAEFLRNCRGTISTETGTWFLERDDALIGEIHQYLRSKRSGLVLGNEGSLRRVARLLPSPVKSVLWQVLRHGPIKFEPLADFDTPFAELHERFFAGRQRAPVYGKAVSSRHFDAIGTKTCQIMLRGRFNDLLEADRHYLALDEDLSNADTVVARYKDPAVRRDIADAAYEHTLSRHTHAHRVAQLMGALMM